MNYVFVVDDDPSVRHGIVRLLRAAGQNVRDYASISDFLDALEPGMTGCLVLDAEMSGKSGKEMLEELKVRDTDLSIIIISNTENRKTKREFLNMKAVGFFRKPVDGTALIDAIDWSLRRNNGYANNNDVKSK